MDSAIKALNDTLSHALRKEVLAGAIVVLHPFGRMSVDEFISAIIQHVPERQFKMIRYYGSYSRKWNGNLVLNWTIGTTCVLAKAL